MLEHARHQTSGGITVLTRPIAANDIVAVHATLPMGTLYEADDEAGISNIVQSVLLRGTRHRSAHAFQDRLAELGAELDAGAGGDLGSITLKATRETWEAALDLMLEAILEPAFDGREVESEVEQTLGVIAAREDQLMTRAMDQFREAFYGAHPYHKPGIGYRKTIRPVDRDRVVAAAGRFYRSAPSIFAVTGRFDPDRLIARLEAALADATAAPAPTRPPPPARSGGEQRLELDREAAYLVHGFPAPGFMDDDYAAAHVMDAVLGGSMSSRLFVELREKRSLAYQVATVYRDRLDGAFLAGYIVTDPERVDQAAEGMRSEFRRVVDEPLTEDELDGAKSYLRGRFLLATETNMAQAGRLARYEAFELGHDFGDRWLDRVAAVTASDVQATAERWLTCEPTRSWVVPAASGVRS